MCKWIIENCFGDETIKFVKGLNYIIVPNLQSIQDIDLHSYFNKHKCIFRGSIEFVKKVYQTSTIKKNYSFDYERYNYKYYSEIFRDYLLNKPIKFNGICKWSDLYDMGDSLMGDRYFIRPLSGLKEFTGTTLSKRRWKQELDIIKNLPNSNISNDLEVLVSPYRKIDKEFRAVIYNNQTSSSCKIVDMVSYDYNPDYTYQLNSAIEFLNNLYSHVDHPDKIYVLDICYAEGQFYVLEINHVLTSGLYGMNGKEIDRIFEELL